MVGAGALIQALTGITFTPAVIIVGGFMLAYVIFGGMLATTWVQIIKATLLMAAGIAADGVRAREGRLQPGRAVHARRASTHPKGDGYLQPGLQFDSGLALLSFGLAFVFGTAGLPHILMRFFTVPDAKAARGSVGWAVFLIGSFYLMVMVVGVGARAILGEAGEKAAGETGNLAIPELARDLGGGEGSDGRRHLPRRHLRGRARDDPRGRRRARDLGVGRGRARPVVATSSARAATPRRRRSGSRKIAAVGIGVLAIALALAGGAGSTSPCSSASRSASPRA